MDVAAFLAALRDDRHYEGQIVATETIPGQAARVGELSPPLPPDLSRALRDQGVPDLYTHQVEAIELARAGRDVVISTGTASGKTLCYNLPVLERILEQHASRALYLFPLKALAHDQLRKLQAYELGGRVRCGAYDGDTPEHERRLLRNNAHIILTNPDMLHLGILPYHSLWADFLANLQYVVVDEVHLYRGVFGSHAAHVFRRLLRLCDRYRSNPTFVCCSATIANPERLVGQLLGRDDPAVVSDSGAPRGTRHVVVWNPPEREPGSGIRRSGNIEATYVIAELVKRRIRTLAFSLARQEAELILRYLRAALDAEQDGLSAKVSAYRAGYLASDRRAIERGLASGELTAVVSTVALEAGIDIGGLDATVMVGYPGTVAGFWQQVGRSGRGSADSLAVLVTRSSVVDQFCAAHPELLWSAPTEEALIDPENIYILGSHLLCAAYELPLTSEDLTRFSDQAELLLPLLEEDGYVAQRQGQWYYHRTGYPAAEVSIRSIDSRPYELVNLDSEQTLGLEDSTRLWVNCYPGSIHLHDGEQYLVQSVDQEERRVLLEPVSVDYFTQPEEDVNVQIDAALEQQSLGLLELRLGELTVTKQTIGYRRHKVGSFELLDSFELDCPAQQMETSGLWITLAPELTDFLTEHGTSVHAGLHAVEHALAAMLPLVAMCDRRDLSGTSTPLHPETQLATTFLFDTCPGGIGLAERGFEQLELLLRRSHELIADCGCEAGCPACIQSQFCESFNQSLDKLAALVILRAALGLDYREEPPRRLSNGHHP